MIDASSSMMARFPAAHLNAKAPNEATFFTTVAAAETFIRQRMSGKYRDLIGLIEFGDEAYVVTPFTTDYDNILLSLSLIGDWTEFMKFPDQGTTIGLAIEQGVALFRAFDFLDASGNLMVIFSDGQDTQVTIHGKPRAGDPRAARRRPRSRCISSARATTRGSGDVLPDDIWKPAVEATGGRFYAADDEPAMLNAIKDIDTSVGGTRRRSSATARSSRSSPATRSWPRASGCVALTLQLTVPYFRKFP